MIFVFESSDGYQQAVDMSQVLAIYLLIGKAHKKDPTISIDFQPDGPSLKIVYDLAERARKDFDNAVAMWHQIGMY